MRRYQWLPFLASVALSGVFASGQATPSQHSAKPGYSGCGVLDFCCNGPYRCPNGSSCGSYVTASWEECNIDNEEFCVIQETESFCCGKYQIPVYEGDPCGLAEMKDPRARSRLLELAKDNEILVPTCRGAHLPAEIALRGRKENVRGGL